MKHKRELIIAGNWKMNKTPQEALLLLGELCEAIPLEHRQAVDVAVAVLAVPAVVVVAAVPAKEIPQSAVVVPLSLSLSASVVLQE